MKALLITAILLIMGVLGISLADLENKEQPQQVFGAGETIPSKLDDPQEVIKIDALKTEIDDLQKDVKVKEKYNQVLKTTNEDGIVYEVHEYKTPSGDTGYQRVLFLDNGEIISEGFGPEAESRTYHFIPLFVAPTST